MKINLIEALGIHRSGMVLGIASNVIKAFDHECSKDEKLKISLIDTMISLLQMYKDEIIAKNQPEKELNEA